jgi:high-affinity nickel-transport protein
MTFGLIVSAFLLGLRHGVDWDHLAAISDIAATQETPRRGVVMSSLYVSGHALVVFVIGSVAIVTGRNLPGWADSLMGVVVGWTLIILGAYVAYTLIRYRGSVPLRSRWMIILRAVRRGYIWARSKVAPVAAAPVAHSHPHSALATFHHEGDEAEPEGRLPRHRHLHVHDPAHEPFTDYTPATSIGIGMLHGIGAETPTQVLVFLAAANAGGSIAGLIVLLAFLVGLALANSAITVGAAYGFFAANRRSWIYTGLAGATAVVSLFVGTLLVLGRDAFLPAFFAG